MNRRPALRWHGGKWLLADWIIGHFPEHRCYVEPFGGAASVLLKKQRSYHEVYNDLDLEVVNFFKVVRDHGERLTRDLELTPFAREEFKLSYEPTSDPIEQARRLVVRSFMGFGSNACGKTTGFRATCKRAGTTQAQVWCTYPAAMCHLIERLQGVVIENRPAIEVMAQHDSPDTLHYVDPPYLPETRDKGSDYNHEMTEQDHVDLAEFLHTLQGTVILSGYESALYCDAFSDWELTRRKAYADGRHGRVGRIECLWIKGDLIQQRMAF